jgi:hypothetical protein
LYGTRCGGEYFLRFAGTFQKKEQDEGELLVHSEQLKFHGPIELVPRQKIHFAMFFSAFSSLKIQHAALSLYTQAGSLPS